MTACQQQNILKWNYFIFFPSSSSCSYYIISYHFKYKNTTWTYKSHGDCLLSDEYLSKVNLLSAFGNVELRTGRSHLVMDGFLCGISPLPPSVTHSLITYLSCRCSADFSSGILWILDCYGYGKQALKRTLNPTKRWKASVTSCFRNWARKIELIASVMRSLSVENSSQHFEAWILLPGWCFLGSSQSPVLQKNGNPEQPDFESEGRIAFKSWQMASRRVFSSRTAFPAADLWRNFHCSFCVLLLGYL